MRIDRRYDVAVRPRIAAAPTDRIIRKDRVAISTPPAWDLRFMAVTRRLGQPPA